MPTPVLQRITAWSFSRWKDYEKCPRMAKYKHVEGKKEPGNAAMQRGSDIDKKTENFLKGLLPKLPEELKPFSKEFTALKKLKPFLQENWAFNSTWGRVGWFDKGPLGAWLRVKMDAAVPTNKKKVAEVIDFKTGKIYPEHKLQVELYALSGFIVFPDAEVIKTNLWYTDLGKEDPSTFTRDQMEGLKTTWMERIKIMMLDTRFPAKPGNHCSWCHFSKGKGGPCEF